MKRLKILSLLLILLIIAILTSCNYRSTIGLKCMATTEWVGGVSRIAGMSNVLSFAPIDMENPSEYELTPMDISVLKKTDVVFYAIYEDFGDGKSFDGESADNRAIYEDKMMKTIRESLKDCKKDIELVGVKVDNSLESLKAESLKIAKKFNKLSKYKQNVLQIEKTYNEMKDTLKSKGLYGGTAYVNVSQLPVAKSLGFNIVGTFGPNTPNAKQIGEVFDLNPDFIIDDYHNEVGSSLMKAVTNSVYLSFINFPGPFETRSINDVLVYAKNKIDELK